MLRPRTDVLVKRAVYVVMLESVKKYVQLVTNFFLLDMPVN